MLLLPSMATLLGEKKMDKNTKFDQTKKCLKKKCAKTRNKKERERKVMSYLHWLGCRPTFIFI